MSSEKEEYEPLLLADGFEECFIGYLDRYAAMPIALYDRRKCIEKLVNDGMTPDDAEEYFQFNVTGGWVGEGTPGFVQYCTLDEYNNMVDEEWS